MKIGVFNEANWSYYNYRDIQKQENQSDYDNNSSAKCFCKNINLGNIELETASEKSCNGLLTAA